MSTVDKKPVDSADEDDRELLALGYKPSFKREFTNLATISFAFSIMVRDYWHEGGWIYSFYSEQGLCSSIAITLNTPLLLGGPSLHCRDCQCIPNVWWTWTITSYTASAHLVPKQHRATVGWLVGWLNILGQIAGLSSTELEMWAVALHGNTSLTVII
ncbi:hypothetical protein BYT27DRAFT_7219125 [Phlegmacium glaucopus]|nr:hypothetical protein BYT27DRAFT_7219125 [Phlegmacium glaucopus]